MVVVNL